ncbi:DUF1176 domain-containing protein [Enterobacter kobei]|uniref:Uncharacterized protein n=2 Tax=Enterobacter kobei TaxID=208224 RepID=A0ACC8S888_9ENTR|nr:DUF1176 domain-containing protein [Enterobacter kobei]OLR19618.1 hypothetical protein BH713_02690 [Enterobacter kobei]BCU57159.1 hypothetical protein ENKO_37530 [Enterobacter kobei]SIR22631.1 Protein of unknown function [Enterobacter kobei]
MKLPYTLAALTLLAAPVIAQENGVSFSHKDWEMVCDNTLTCRAAGYSTEETEEGTGGSVLLTRKAGPDSAVAGEVVLADTESDDNATSGTLMLWINDQPAGALKAAEDDRWTLTTAQTQALIKAVKGSGKVEVKEGRTPFVLSGNGATAVLLKMDDVQGRIGTPGAFIKKGDKPESSVHAAVPAPVIQAVKVTPGETRTLSKADADALKPQLLATLNKDAQCDRLQPAEGDAQEGDGDITVTPLDARHVLASTLCWRGAYNEGYGYWVIANTPDAKPVLVTESATDYSDGVIAMGQKGRGLGDCWATASWVWDGTAFRLSHESTTGMCRYLRLGGTWDLPTWVADVKPAAK